MKIIKSNKFLNLVSWFFKVDGIALYPFVIVRPSVSAELIRHELIHLEQQKELLVLPFYILYVTEFLIKLVCYRNAYQAYRSISFERESYGNQKKIDYLTYRKRFAWLRYLWN